MQGLEYKINITTAEDGRRLLVGDTMVFREVEIGTGEFELVHADTPSAGPAVGELMCPLCREHLIEIKHVCPQCGELEDSAFD